MLPKRRLPRIRANESKKATLFPFVELYDISLAIQLNASASLQGGLGGFFGKGGLKTQWARDIPYAMVTLLVYESLQKAAARRRGPKSPKASPFENMVIGAVAGGMGSLVTNPMDMIKTRMMTSPEMYTGPMDAAWIALRKEGPQVKTPPVYAARVWMVMYSTMNRIP